VLFVAAITIVMVTNVVDRPHKRVVADHSPLVEVTVNGQVRLRHPVYGFSVLRPPKTFVEKPELVATLGIARDPESAYYAFAEPLPTVIVMVGVMCNEGASRADFADVTRGIRSGFTHAMSKENAPVKTLREDTAGAEGHLVQHLHFVVEGMHFQFNTYQIMASDWPAVAVVMVVGRDAKELADVLDSFQP
jgi:hypothetical protein